jgi:hypothetical protein
MMTPVDRWTETTRLVVPIAALLLIAVWWSLRFSTASIRQEIAQALACVQGCIAVGTSVVCLKKAS